MAHERYFIINSPESPGAEIKRLREAAGLSQGELARRTGKDRAQLSRTESDETGMSPQATYEVAQALNASPNEALGLSQRRSHPKKIVDQMMYDFAVSVIETVVPPELAPDLRERVVFEAPYIQLPMELPEPPPVHYAQQLPMELSQPAKLPSSRPSKLQRVTDDIRTLVIAGKLKGKLPSRDALAEQVGCSYVTINRALNLLAGNGVVDARGNQGYWTPGSWTTDQEKPKRTPVYIKTADTIRLDILDGKYPDTEKLPSLRTFAETHGCRIKTIGSALDILKRQRVITSRGIEGLFINRETIEELRRQRE